MNLTPQTELVLGAGLSLFLVLYTLRYQSFSLLVPLSILLGIAGFDQIGQLADQHNFDNESFRLIYICLILLAMVLTLAKTKGRHKGAVGLVNLAASGVSGFLFLEFAYLLELLRPPLEVSLVDPKYKAVAYLTLLLCIVSWAGLQRPIKARKDESK